MKKMVIIGICGKMGNQMYEYYKDTYEIVGVDIKKHEVVSTLSSIDEIENVDVIVDFSSTECYEQLKKAILSRIPVLSGTTGYDLSQIEALENLAKEKETPFVWKANYARGIKLFSKLIDVSKGKLEYLDFVEIHATTKKDAPSGTAKVLARQLEIKEDKIQSLRINQAPAIHEIIFSSDDERVILRHEIMNKKAFIIGFDEELKNVVRS
ncbi:MAG: hypothetical protein K2I77_05815 [Anaeroplasmataceae bacterium]|nr:hypothetical protein [Anaeroplasmataceae bacterium]